MSQKHLNLHRTGWKSSIFGCFHLFVIQFSASHLYTGCHQLFPHFSPLLLFILLGYLYSISYIIYTIYCFIPFLILYFSVYFLFCFVLFHIQMCTMWSTCNHFSPFSLLLLLKKRKEKTKINSRHPANILIFPYAVDNRQQHNMVMELESIVKFSEWSYPVINTRPHSKSTHTSINIIHPAKQYLGTLLFSSKFSLWAGQAKEIGKKKKNNNNNIRMSFVSDVVCIHS